MHREIQIKQFPIVTTHWWPKTRNERFVWETNSIYIVFYLLYTTMSKWSECAHASGVWRVCARSGSRCIHTGRRRQRLTEGVSEAWCWHNFSSANGGVSQSDRPMQIPNPIHATPEKYVIDCCNYDGASAPRFRHALRQAWRRRPVWMQREPERAHTHVTHRMCVRTQITWTWCVQEVKNDINTVCFLTQTACFVS